MPNKQFVRFDNVDKSYDGKELVVKGLNLDIAEGEFVTMLGPSGSGKTTCLMMLAGFETPTNGQIYLDNNVISDDKLNDLFKSLKEINAKLWLIEDDKRQCEKDKDFGEKFIKLSRDIHFLNDDRAKIKLEINNYTGSVIKEIKEYTSY